MTGPGDVDAPAGRQSTAETLAAPTPGLAELDNTRALGSLIYTDYIYLFQAAGIVLLIAMLGCIMLTLKPGSGASRKQKIADQNARRPDQTLEVRKVPTGGGI